MNFVNTKSSFSSAMKKIDMHSFTADFTLKFPVRRISQKTSLWPVVLVVE